MGLALANKITIVRILFIPFFLACLLYYKPGYDFLRLIALGLFIACALTDVIDGYVARKFYQKTKLGRILDPLADKLLLLTAFLSLSTLSNLPAAVKIPAWLTIIVISRDAIILMGSAIIFVMIKDIEIKPSVLGKMTTFLQMLTVALSLLGSRFVNISWYLAAIFTISSGLGYIWYGTRVLNESH
jgi:CDP-diacylglycerol--glycerol-3-phosphate 3-phosphatidyltransferase